MKQKNKKIAVQNNNKENKKASESFASNNVEELELHWDDSCCQFKSDAEAMAELSNLISDWVPVGIYLEIEELIRGLDPKLAKNVARYIGEFCWGMGRTVTGLEFLDPNLLDIYKRIYEHAKAHGHKLDTPCIY